MDEQTVTPGNVNETAEKMVMPEEMKAAREKYWDELTVEEKLDRARRIIKNLEEEVRMLRQGHEKLSWQFRKHGHDANGVVTLPLEQAEQMLYSGLIPNSALNHAGRIMGGIENNKYF